MINKSELEWCLNTLNKVLRTSFPEYILKWLKEKLFISSETSIALFIEYAKFIILKSRFPQEWIWPHYIDQVWREHFVYTKHYFDFWYDILNWEDGIIEYSHPQLSFEEFDQMYSKTKELYTFVFGVEPIKLINREYKYYL